MAKPRKSKKSSNDVGDSTAVVTDSTDAPPWTWMRVLMDALSSSRVTVVLVVASIVLVFFGTLAQYYLDMWAVIDQYFRAWICWVDLKILFPPSFFPLGGQDGLGAPRNHAFSLSGRSANRLGARH